MCRGKNNCSELDNDPAKWDRHCPLRQPGWMDKQVDLFVEALEEFIKGNRESCLKQLSSIRSDEIQSWYIEHGQMSGRHRRIALNIEPPALIDESLRDPLRAPKKYQKEVFLRDGYKCRYCGNRLISQKLMTVFIKKLNSSSFKKGPTNLDRHGIVHITWPVADHVVPWNLGGRTNMDNLVSSCATCNYGKDGNTIEQLGMENPFDRAPIINKWDGLISKIENVKNIA